MSARVSGLADQLTTLRLILVVPLWVLALLGQRVPLGIGLAVAGLTDVLDGPIARRQGTLSRFGGQLDSIADHTLSASAVAWVAMYRPAFFREYGTLLLAWVALAALTIAVGLFRFRRFANVHLWSAKAAGFVGYSFAIWLLLFEGAATPFFHVAIALAFIGTVETLIALATWSRVDDHAGSIFRRRKR